MSSVHEHANLSSDEALQKLKDGNTKYLSAVTNPGDISPAIRKDTCDNGQHPYAVVVTCSDSRVIPEGIFSAGIGELFVIRTAGNTISDSQLGSIEYAVEHLGCNLIVVLGHTNCGAVGAAISSSPEGFVKSITDEIKLAIGAETDAYKACCLNVKNSVSRVEDKLQALFGNGALKAVSAVYHIDDGHVEFID